MTGACDKLAESSAAVAAWGMTLSCSSSLHNTTAARHTFVTHQIVLEGYLQGLHSRVPVRPYLVRPDGKSYI